MKKKMVLVGLFAMIGMLVFNSNANAQRSRFSFSGPHGSVTVSVGNAGYYGTYPDNRYRYQQRYGCNNNAYYQNNNPCNNYYQQSCRPHHKRRDCDDNYAYNNYYSRRGNMDDCRSYDNCNRHGYVNNDYDRYRDNGYYRGRR
ncbi:MAG: hypothetical protein JST82_13295 [Bacteroidetes bacterium]|nr:hypothetical protein [Bacteroidota bacterium]